MTSIYPSPAQAPMYTNLPPGPVSPNTYRSSANVGGFVPQPSPSHLSPYRSLDAEGRMLSISYSDRSNRRRLSPNPSALRSDYEYDSDDDESSGSTPPIGAMSGSRTRSGQHSRTSRRHRKVGFGLPPDYIPASSGPSPSGHERPRSRGRSLTPPPLSPRGSAVRNRLHDAHPTHHLFDTLRPPTPYARQGGSVSPYGGSHGSSDSYSRSHSSHPTTTFPQESIPAGTSLVPQSSLPNQPATHVRDRKRSRAHSHSQPRSSRHHHDGHEHHRHRHHHRDRDASVSGPSSRPIYNRRRSRSLPPVPQTQPLVYNIHVPPQQPNVHVIPPNTTSAQYHQQPNGSSRHSHGHSRRRAHSSSHSHAPQYQIYAPPYNNQSHHTSLPPAGSQATGPPHGSQARPPHTGFISSLLKGLNINKSSNHAHGADPGTPGGGRSAGYSPRARERQWGWRSGGQQQTQMTTMPIYGAGYGQGYGQQVPLHVQPVPMARRHQRRMSF